jgi:hypothetical protein
LKRVVCSADREATVTMAERMLIHERAAAELWRSKR